MGKAAPSLTPRVNLDGLTVKLTTLLEDGVRGGVFPGAVLIVGKEGETIFRAAAGQQSSRAIKGAESVSQTTVDTVFDVASLTGAIVTATLVLKLSELGKLSLDDKVTRYLQGFGVYGKSKITIRQLLNHNAGLPAWAPFFESILEENAGPRLGIMTSRSARDFVYDEIQRLPLKYEPGERYLYSDLGSMLLGNIIEVLTGLSLDKAAFKYVFQPMGLKSSSYIDLSMIKRRGIHPITDLIAATEECPWRKRVLCGEVHDDNAWAMGGIAGHSGLFSSAPDIHKFARVLLASYHGVGEFLKKETLRKEWAGEEDAFKGGWDTPSKENGMIDSGLSPQAIGMCGFTGCSLWIEPDRAIDIVLMSNRIHPTRSNKKIVQFRADLHRAVLDSLPR